MSDFEIVIASPYDRENLVAEIWFKEDLICELNTENEKLEIVFYIKKSNCKYNFNEFNKTINNAKLKLVG
jgi:hypothetical protein